MADRETIVRWAEVEPFEQVPRLFRRTLSTTDKIMICEFRALPGALVPNHQHPHDQVGYVVSGEIKITIAGETSVCKAGDGYAILGGVEHSAIFESEAVVIDSFTPPREDYE